MVVFRAPVQERLQLTGKGSGERHQDIEGMRELWGGKLALWGVGEGLRIVQPGEGISLGAPYSNLSAAVRRLLSRQLWTLDADVP